MADGLRCLRCHITRRWAGATRGDDQAAVFLVGEIAQRRGDHGAIVGDDPRDRLPTGERQLGENRIGDRPGPSEDVRAWQMRKIKERQKAADEGRFASSEAVRAVIRKFIPNG